MTDSNNNIHIAGSLYLKINVGPFGKYVQVYRGNRWISLSNSSWQHLVQNLAAIEGAITEGKEFGLTLTDTKSVTVSMFRGNTFINLTEKYHFKGKEMTKYINFTRETWSKIVDNIPDACDLLDSFVAYKGVDDKWSLVKPKSMENVCFRLISRIADNDFNLLVASYYLEKAINSKALQTCSVCKAGGFVEVCDCDCDEMSVNHFREHVNDWFDQLALTLPIYELVQKWNQKLGFELTPWFIVRDHARLNQHLHRRIHIKAKNCDNFEEIFSNTAELIEGGNNSKNEAPYADVITKSQHHG